MIKRFEASYMTDNSLLYEHVDIQVNTDGFDSYNDRYVTWESAIRSALLLENSDHRTKLSCITLIREESDYKALAALIVKENGKQEE